MSTSAAVDAAADPSAAAAAAASGPRPAAAGATLFGQKAPPTTPSEEGSRAAAVKPLDDVTALVDRNPGEGRWPGGRREGSGEGEGLPGGRAEEEEPSGSRSGCLNMPAVLGLGMGLVMGEGGLGSAPQGKGRQKGSFPALWKGCARRQGLLSGLRDTGPTLMGALMAAFWAVGLTGRPPKEACPAGGGEQRRGRGLLRALFVMLQGRGGPSWSPSHPAPRAAAAPPASPDHPRRFPRRPAALPLGAAVAPFWEAVDPHSPEALRTPRELAEALVGEGYCLSYCRIPLSRERTPEAADVAALHRELAQAVQLRAEGRVAEVVHLILSRTATGSSAR